MANGLIAESRREAAGRRPATGKQPTETAGLPGAAGGRATWRRDLLHEPDIPGRPPDDLRAAGIVLPDFAAAAVAVDSAAVAAADSGAAVTAEVAEVEVVAVDAVQTSGSSTTSCYWAIWRTDWVTTASSITAATTELMSGSWRKRSKCFGLTSSNVVATVIFESITTGSACRSNLMKIGLHPEQEYPV
jgi:zona occludens toxin (predicted ATPase)